MRAFHETFNAIRALDFNKPIPFDFVFDYLPLSVNVKQMFGMFAVYLDEKIVLVLRKSTKSPEKDGVWIAMGQEHAGLQNDLPGLTPISLSQNEANEAKWQYLPADLEDFESLVIKACGLIKSNDSRIGHVPNLGRKRRVKQ